MTYKFLEMLTGSPAVERAFVPGVAVTVWVTLLLYPCVMFLIAWLVTRKETQDG